MNILLVTGPDITLKQPFNSGIEAFIVSLANQLVRRGHTVDVIARDAEPDVLFNVICADISSLDIDDYDVIHYHLFIPALYEIAAKFDKPSVLTLHSPMDRKRADTYRKFARKSNVTFVAISDRIKRQWDPALNVDMPIIRNGIDLEQWTVKQRANGKYLLWSARINDEKNVAAAISLSKHTGQPLKIAGRIVNQDYFDTRVKPFLNDKIEYVGHVTQRELSALSNDASAFLATAKWQEPFGLAALEMLASGLQVIGFESAVPTDLQFAGVSTAPSTDWHDLVPLLSRIGSVSPEQCRKFASTMSAEAMTSHYIDLYQELCSDELTDITEYESVQTFSVTPEIMM